MLIDHFFAPGRESLDSRYPILCGAMTWINHPTMVAAYATRAGSGF